MPLTFACRQIPGCCRPVIWPQVTLVKLLYIGWKGLPKLGRPAIALFGPDDAFVLRPAVALFVEQPVQLALWWFNPMSRLPQSATSLTAARRALISLLAISFASLTGGIRPIRDLHIIVIDIIGLLFLICPIGTACFALAGMSRFSSHREDQGRRRTMWPAAWLW